MVPLEIEGGGQVSFLPSSPSAGLVFFVDGPQRPVWKREVLSSFAGNGGLETLGVSIEAKGKLETLQEGTG